MKNIILKYKGMSFEQKTIFNTILSLCFSFILALGKLILGIFTDYSLCAVAVYTFAILLSKFQFVLGVKTNKVSFKTRNLLISLFLFVSSFFYIGLMASMLFIERPTKEYSLYYVSIFAFISFVELGFAISGILRTKNKGHYYRDIKIINFCVALIAILTMQIALLDFKSTPNASVYNAYSGIGLGVFIAICSLYIYTAPYTSIIDREYNVFMLSDETKNNLIDLSQPAACIMLSKSIIYGSFIYLATISGNEVKGSIQRENSIWKRMNIIIKILCCILSEVLFFVWLAGRFIFYLRSINLPKRLEKKMNNNGFIKIG